MTAWRPFAVEDAVVAAVRGVSHRTEVATRAGAVEATLRAASTEPVDAAISARMPGLVWNVTHSAICAAVSDAPF